MKTPLLSTIAIGALALSACGSDGDSDPSGVQAEAAQQFIDSASGLGMDLDDQCVNDLAADLSDDDAQRIVDAGPEGDAELSDEGEALTDEALGCIDASSLVDFFLEQLVESGATFDEDCARERLEDADLASDLTGDEPPAELINALEECAG